MSDALASSSHGTSNGCCNPIFTIYLMRTCPCFHYFLIGSLAEFVAGLVEIEVSSSGIGRLVRVQSSGIDKAQTPIENKYSNDGDIDDGEVTMVRKVVVRANGDITDSGMVVRSSSESLPATIQADTSPVSESMMREEAHIRKHGKEEEIISNVQKAVVATWTKAFPSVKMMREMSYRPSSMLILVGASSSCLLLIIAFQCAVQAGMGGIIYGQQSLLGQRGAGVISARNSIGNSQWEPEPKKMQLKEKFTAINHRNHVRACRQKIKLRIVDIFEELVANNTVDKNSYLLLSGEESNNVFAKLGSGTMKQSAMDIEQAALGKYQDRYVVCANRRIDDMQWNTKDPEFIPRASMSGRHRFLTTKDMHWQWFNPIVFGLVPESHGGVTLADALEKVIEIEEAAMHYVDNSSGWSKDVQLFFHPYPHNGLNALCIHILDMNELGLGFGYHLHKNCALDVLKTALQEEMRLNQQGEEASEISAEEKKEEMRLKPQGEVASEISAEEKRQHSCRKLTPPLSLGNFVAATMSDGATESDFSSA